MSDTDKVVPSTLTAAVPDLYDVLTMVRVLVEEALADETVRQALRSPTGSQEHEGITLEARFECWLTEPVVQNLWSDK